MLRHLDAANLVTLGGIALSVTSMALAMGAHFEGAMLALIGCGVVDLVDGFVARRLKREKLTAEIGKQLDSLVDLVSFGVTPAVFAYCFGLHHPVLVGIVMLFVMASAFRLAYFDAVGLIETEDRRVFVGLPTTYSSLFIPLVFAFRPLAPASMVGILAGLYALLAVAMVSGLKIPKPRARGYALLALLAVGLAAWYAVAIARLP